MEKLMFEKLNPLTAVSSVDGRYADKTAPLRKYFSEAALIRYRLIMEVLYLIKLGDYHGVNVPALTEEQQKLLIALSEHPDAPRLVKQIETKGIEGFFNATNHDVKAVEYFLRYKITDTELRDYIPFLHLGLTSEDTTNIAISLSIMEALRDVIIPSLSEISEALNRIAEEHADTPMVALTHGQPASPTSMGKEARIFHERLSQQLQLLHAFEMRVKLNGASGNYNAHFAAYPQVDWMRFSYDYIHTLEAERGVHLKVNYVTPQIEPHDTYAELFHIMQRINTILINLSKDMWSYISLGWIGQKVKKGEVGSSTMPHKVNPIDWENAEGNLGVANALFAHLAAKLPDYRYQRDLSDSTAQRTLGTAFGHSLIAFTSILKGFGKISINKEAMLNALRDNPELITEAIQTILRREGIHDAYELLKSISRGKHGKVTLSDIHTFIRTLPVSDTTKQELMELTPENYLGLSSEIARN